MRAAKLSVLCGFLMLFQACGGGGGGGGSSSHGVRVLHASLDDAPVSVETSANPGEALAIVRFAEIAGYSAVPKGTQTVSVEGGQLAKISSPSFSAEGDDRRSLLFYRNASNNRPVLAIFEDVDLDLESTQSAVRFIQAVKGAAVVDIAVGSASASVSYAESSDYLVLPAGAVSIEAKRHADGRALISSSRNLEGGKTYSVLLSGEVGYAVFLNLFEG